MNLLRIASLLLALALPLSAQGSARPLELPRDSALFRRLREFIVPRVQSNIADRDSLPSYPLLFRIQDSGDTPQWSVLQREISSAVRGRGPIESDRLKHTVAVQSARITDARFEAFVTIGTEMRCGGTWVGDAQEHAVFATRAPDGGWPPLGITETVMYDSFGGQVLPVEPEQMPEAQVSMARVQQEFPCPARLPPWWTAADTFLGKGLRCSLVAAAVAAGTAPRARANAPGIDTTRVTCVRLESYVYFYSRPDGTHEPAQWVAVLIGPQQHLRVLIEASTGKVSQLVEGVGGMRCRP